MTIISTGPRERSNFSPNARTVLLGNRHQVVLFRVRIGSHLGQPGRDKYMNLLPQKTVSDPHRSQARHVGGIHADLFP